MDGNSRLRPTEMLGGDAGAGNDPALRRRRQAPTGGEFRVIACRDGASLRIAFWDPRDAARCRGTVLLLHGRTEFIEKHFETIWDLLDRGFAVATFDWRGQGLSARPLADRQRGHAADFAAYLEDLELFVELARARLPGPYAILAHSFGGHCAVRFLHDHPGVVTRAVLVAPMLGIHFAPLPLWLVRGLVGFALFMGWGDRFGPGQGGYSPERRRAEADLLTSDRDRLEDEIAACGGNPDLALGGVTWGWLGAALRSIRRIHGRGFAEAIEIPVLTVIAGRDRVVDNRLIRAFAARLPRGEVTEIADARHEILKERDELRNRFWAAFDRFMG